MVSKDDDVVDDKGLPLVSFYDGKPPVPILIPVFTLVMMAVAQGIVWPIYYSNAVKYDAKLQFLAKNDLGWVYVGFVAMKLGFSLGLGVILAMSRKACKVNVPDQQVYSVYTKPGAPKLGYVLMEKEGLVGRFNRAQRAFQNYLEVAPVLVGYFLLAGFVFPFPTFCIGMLFSAARIIAALGYVESADGRTGGSILSTFALTVLEALVLLAGVKAISFA